MQEVAEKSSVSTSPKVIVFRTRMGAQAPFPPEQPSQPLLAPVQPTWWQQHGTTATWAAIVVTALIGLASIGTTWHFHSVDSDAKVSDEHIRNLVEDKFKPLNRDVFDDKVGKLSDKIDELSDRMTRVEQRLDDLHSDLQKQSELQKDIRKQALQAAALARLQADPADRLDKIRKDIQTAESKKEPIPYSKLVDYKLAVHALPPSAADYWKTVAAIINYESFLEQTLGHAPNPTKISRPCPLTTNSPYTRDNLIVGTIVRGCIVDLDSANGFVGTIFVDCVVRYRGGRVAMQNVQFRNCAFQLDIPAEAPPIIPERDRILFTMLDAPNLRDITVTSTHS